MQLTTQAVLNRRPLKHRVSVEHDSPRAKVVRIAWDRSVRQSDTLCLEWRYLWPATWSLVNDVYTYDVLGWLDNLEYRFVLPPSWRVTRISTSLIDIFGRKWDGCGEVDIRANAFILRAKRLPMFCSVVVTHRAVKV
jgi:hypothetical protein